ncbi:MAG TPA: (d)CMP kinase [Gemmataceae bacterium]|nr:(d)CMP kinase [Gemmataceae bacterium]
MIVTIDGPAGSGKSTAAKGLARRLGFEFLDTGAMYRAVALALTRADIPFGDTVRVIEFLNHTRLEIVGGHVVLDGEDVNEAIRHPSMSDASSRVAVEPHVRAVLVQWQRRVAQGRDMVCEGRDQGSVVFTDSPCKFFLTASIPTRAARRLAELRTRGVQSTLERVTEELEIRDHRDRTREVGPLMMPDDAIVIETDALTADQVLDRLEAEVRRCRRG